jgi:hypothetical protein
MFAVKKDRLKRLAFCPWPDRREKATFSFKGNVAEHEPAKRAGSGQSGDDRSWGDVGVFEAGREVWAHQVAETSTSDHKTQITIGSKTSACL